MVLYNDVEFLSTHWPEEPTMHKNIITLAISSAVGLLALAGLQGSAQAYEYRHREARVEHRYHDHDRGIHHDRYRDRGIYRSFSRHRDRYRDHDRR
jgi:hypothetical protein